MGKLFLKWAKGYGYICKLSEEDKRKHERILSLGKIPEEEAKIQLKQLAAKSKLEIKPIYRTIVIDPPWPIKKSKRSARLKQVDMDYEVMSLDEVKRFPLRKFISIGDGCHVYLWTTHKHLPDAFDVFKTWGVNYHCTLTWVKNVGFTPFTWMFSTEFVLFGMVGNLSVIRKGIRTDFKGKVREHSRKPDEFYEIVKRVSPEPRVDIFSREKRDGFDQYGFEVDMF